MSDKKSAPATKADLKDLATKAELKKLATKADLVAVKSDITAVKTEVAAVKTEVAAVKTEVAAVKTEVAAVKTEVAAVKTEVAAVKTELKSDIKRLEDIVKTNTLDILHIKEDIHDIRDTMATRDDINRLMNHIDAFAAEALSYRNHDKLRGGKIMEHETQIKDHENRLTTLETK